MGARGDAPGFAKMPRWLFDPRSRTAHDHLMRSVYMHLVMKANWADGAVPLGRQKVFVKRGQVATSPQTIADELGVPRKAKSIERRIFDLQTDQRIVLQRDQHGSLITIVNYDCCDEGGEMLSNAVSSESSGVCPTPVQQLSTSEEEQEEIRIQEEDKLSHPPRARARIDPETQARQILQAALGAQWLQGDDEAHDTAYSELTEAAARLELDDFGLAVVLRRYRTLHAFWAAYRSRRLTTAAGMVDQQFRTDFVAIILDPAFDPKAVLARRQLGHAVSGRTDEELPA